MAATGGCDSTAAGSRPGQGRPGHASGPRGSWPSRGCRGRPGGGGNGPLRGAGPASVSPAGRRARRPSGSAAAAGPDVGGPGACGRRVDPEPAAAGESPAIVRATAAAGFQTPEAGRKPDGRARCRRRSCAPRRWTRARGAGPGRASLEHQVSPSQSESVRVGPSRQDWQAAGQGPGRTILTELRL